MMSMDHVMLWDPAVQEFREVGADVWWDDAAEGWHFVPEETGYWPFCREDRELLDRAMRISPRSRAAVGPYLRGPRGANPLGKHLPGWGVLSGSCRGSPVATLAHELVHEIWHGIPFEDLDVLQAHGDRIRTAYEGAPETLAWLDGEGEAEALAFERHFVGQGQPAGVALPDPVRLIFACIEGGAMQCSAVVLPRARARWGSLTLTRPRFVFTYLSIQRAGRRVRFEWDPAKAAANLAKHGIAFEDAARVFDDPLQRSRQDRTEGGEQRWQTLGMAGRTLVLLLVAHTWREDEDEVIRIISARTANRRERRDYGQGRN